MVREGYVCDGTSDHVVGDKFRAIVVIEGLLWRGTGEGKISGEGTLESHTYHADVIAV